MTEEKYNAAESAESNHNNRKISFLTDSFDSLSSTVESRKSLTTPTGWSGSVSGTASSKSTLSGILFAGGRNGANYEYETELVDGTLYARVLGADYTVDSDEATPTAEEIEAAKKDEKYADVKDDEAALVARLKEEKVIKLKKDNWIPVSALNANSGNQHREERVHLHEFCLHSQRSVLLRSERIRQDVRHVLRRRYQRR